MNLDKFAHQLAGQLRDKPEAITDLMLLIARSLEQTMTKHDIVLSLEEATQAQQPEETSPSADTEPAAEPTPEAVPAEVKADEAEKQVPAEDKQEAPETEEPKAEVKDEATYVEEFGLLATTHKQHLEAIVENGGLLYREKRSLMLCLHLKDELVAIAKTIDYKKFPEDVQEHFKNNGFVSADVVGFGPQKKRSRSVYSNVTFKNLAILSDDHEDVVNARALLTDGTMPKHAEQSKQAKEEEAKKEEVKVEPKKEEAAAETSEAKETSKPTPKAAPTQSLSFPLIYLVNPQVKALLTEKKEEVLKESYAVAIEGTTARLFTKGAGGKVVVIGVHQGTAFEEGTYKVNISDYVQKESEGTTYAKFDLTHEKVSVAKPEAQEGQAPAPESTPVQEEEVTSPVAEPKPEAPKVEEPTAQKSPEPLVEASVETPDAPKATDEAKVEPEKQEPKEEDRAPIELVATQDVPADFPNTTTFVLDLHPFATKILNKDNAKAMQGQDVPILTKRNAEGDGGTVSFIYGIFETAIGTAAFTQGELPVAKWLARLAGVDLIEDEATGATQLILVIDRLKEVDAFPGEEPGVAVSSYTAITEEGFKKFYAERKAKAEAAKAATPAQADEEVVRKPYDPSAVKQVVQGAAADGYGQGVREVAQPVNPTGGSVSELRASTAVTPEDRKEITGGLGSIVSKTLNETNIHATETQKQTTEVVGNLNAAVGVLTKTDVLIQFGTSHPESIWRQSIGREVSLVSEIHFAQGGATQKLVKMIGKNGHIVAQGYVSTSEAVLMDGNQHRAKIIGVEGSQAHPQGHVVAMRLSEFQRVQ